MCLSANASRWECKRGTDIEPIDVLVPVLPRDGQVRNVRLLGIILGIAIGLGGAGHRRGLRHELGVDSGLAGDGLVRRHGEAVKDTGR